ncbi:MAG: DegT/DnrJ/EryC1/StrS family aminotransferase [Ignavibacteria bacterium]|nr:DegT/DnrJ/EryC1/StrS family aminotransferase [Ignavibacteria bacterium]
MNLPFGVPLIGDEEKNAVLEVLSNPILVHGPRATTFENDFSSYTKAPYAVSVSSCTAGLHLLYFCLGYGPGDEVIVPAQTHIATAHAVELCGAKPVFIDAELETGNIDISKIEAAITKKTKAISIVHYLGVPVDMSAIVSIAKKHNLFVVEDCALSIGSYHKGTHTGLIGDAGVFSFYPVKHMTTAEGGMIILKDETLAKKLKLNKAFGVDRTHGERKIPGVYDTIDLGFNYRMSEIHAAIGIEQLKKLPSFLAKRKRNFEILEETLSSCKKIRVIPQPYNNITQSCHYCLSLVLDNTLVEHRPAIMNELTAKNIGSSVYYPQPVPRMTYYKKKYGYNAVSFKNAAILSDHTIALPVGPHLSEENMKTIGEQFLDIIKVM